MFPSKLLPGLFLLIFCISLKGQDKNSSPGGQISGSLQSNANFFIRDSLIGAANIPQYDRQKFGADAWLNLNYSNWGFDFGFRFDVFNNSNLLNPTDSYTAQGVGMWFVKKQVDKLGIQAGYIYDQIGSGIIFRAFEERPLLIDNALIGLKLSYQITPNWQIRGFTGRQKQQFDAYKSIIKGMAFEGFISSDDNNPLTLAPGFGIVARTLDDQSMNQLVATLNTYAPKDAFVPRYNSYAFTAYNTLTKGSVTWYLEGAYKTRDAINNPFARSVINGDTITGDRFINVPGSVVYSTLSFSGKHFGLTLEGKRTQNFTFRTRPQAQLNRGMVNFLPPMARTNTYRLTARYNAATQELGELAFQGDLRYTPSKKLTLNVNVSNIANLQGKLLYREIYAEIQLKIDRKQTLQFGLQRQEYNQEVYEYKPQVPIVRTITPFVEYQYKFSRISSLRTELQYMHTGRDAVVGYGQDYGSWVYLLAEWSIAPRWTFTAADMYNVVAGRNSPERDGKKLNFHFPRFDVFYSVKSNRFSLSFVKQVQGVVCTGGICRLEPAFSGVKFAVTSTF